MSQEQQDIADLKAWRKIVEPTLNELHHDVKFIVEKMQAIDCAECKTKINNAEQTLMSLQLDRSLIRGGWIALCVIGSALVGLSLIVGGLAAWLTIKHH